MAPSSDTPRTPRPLLQARGLAVTYPNGHRALHATDLAVLPGEFLVLLGPSGAGKSTLMRALNALVPPTEGSVWFEGIGEARKRGALRQLRTRAAMVFQQHQLIGRLTALDNVLTGRLGLHSGLRTLLPLPRADRLIALQALENVGLIDHALHRCDQLSGGQQQRVGIARALAQQPRVMLADEPVASLDPATAQRVLALIHEVCRSAGIAAVVSLHQVELARRYADRIVALAAGRVVFDDVPAALDSTALARIYGQGALIEAAEPAAHRPSGAEPALAVQAA
jgi:phosphonate transport system ATP-binding protein